VRGSWRGELGGVEGSSGGRLMPFGGGSGVGAGSPRTVSGAARGSTHGVGANTRASAHPTTSGRHKFYCRLVTIYAFVILPPPLLPYVFTIITVAERTQSIQTRVAHDAPISGASGARDGYDALLTPH